jgi:hypothetical protein
MKITLWKLFVTLFRAFIAKHLAAARNWFAADGAQPGNTWETCFIISVISRVFPAPPAPRARVGETLLRFLLLFMRVLVVSKAAMKIALAFTAACNPFRVSRTTRMFTLLIRIFFIPQELVLRHVIDIGVVPNLDSATRRQLSVFA